MTLELLGVGRHRAVFALPGERYVLKVPIVEMGYFDNSRENRLCRRDGWLLRKQMARCRLLPSGLLVMERVTEPHEHERRDFPDWVGGVDCGQVGYTQDGRLVAYDFA